MPTSDANPPAIETRTTCPLCDAQLDPTHPNECPKCDWISESMRETGGTMRDTFSVVFSIVPGLGHIYKHHRLLGALLMMGSVFATFAALLAGSASAGWGMLLLPLYWAGVMMHVYFLEDLGVAPTRKR